jgi:uncharacterized spore protein YtfJ
VRVKSWLPAATEGGESDVIETDDDGVVGGVGVGATVPPLPFMILEPHPAVTHRASNAEDTRTVFIRFLLRIATQASNYRKEPIFACLIYHGSGFTS